LDAAGAAADHLLPADYAALAGVWHSIDLQAVDGVRSLQVTDFDARLEQGDIRRRAERIFSAYQRAACLKLWEALDIRSLYG